MSDPSNTERTATAASAEVRKTEFCAELTSATEFRRALVRWYKTNARDLPWRRTHDPYAIWISEIMLQQTQVATVLDYYARFLGRFPTVSSVAEADEEEVLQYWSGLGYYRRARQLHAAAKKVVELHGGDFPVDLDAIKELPGIGRYTAGAIYSFSTDGRATIVEANTARLYARLMALEADLSAPKTQKALWQFAESIIPSRGSGTGQCNQALIEIGSQICTPQAPKCMLCPVSKHCAAFEQGLQDRIPPPKAKKKAEQLVHAMVLVRHKGYVLIRQNEPGQWWQGLWEFARLDMTNIGSRRRKIPTSTQARNESILKLDELQSSLWEQHQIDCTGFQFRTVFSHAVTRYRIRLECFTVDTSSKLDLDALSGVWKWCPVERLGVPLSAPSRKAQRLLLE